MTLRPLLIAHLLGVVPYAAFSDPPRASLPAGAVRYEPATHTQALSQNRGVGDFAFRRVTAPVPITSMPNTDWHQSGGMRGLKDVTSEKYRTGGAAASKYAPITIKNGLVRTADGRIDLKKEQAEAMKLRIVEEFTQKEYGIVRTYPDGVRFDDVLKYKGVVFEHRVREKKNGVWSSRVVFEDKDARPPGYTGLKVTCASCHDQAGSGGYAEGLVPGGDTVFSDPLDWGVVPKQPVYVR